MSPDQGRFTERLAPTVSRRILASRLRQIRTDAGLTLEDVAGRLGVSKSKISRLETEGREPQVADVRRLTQIFDLPAAEASQLIDLAHDARQPFPWWGLGATAPEKDYFGLEAAASSVRGVDLLQIHGLLQTKAYTRALLEPLDLGPAQSAVVRLEQIGESRRIRQERLLDPAGLQLDVVVGEAALETLIGSADVMHAQVRHLLNMSGRPNVTLRVLPFSAGATAAHTGNFVILGFQEPHLGKVVYLESLTGQTIVDDAAGVAEYESAFSATVVKALNPDASRALLHMNLKRWNAA